MVVKTQLENVSRAPQKYPLMSSLQKMKRCCPLPGTPLRFCSPVILVSLYVCFMCFLGCCGVFCPVSRVLFSCAPHQPDFPSTPVFYLSICPVLLPVIFHLSAPSLLLVFFHLLLSPIFIISLHLHLTPLVNLDCT